MSIEKYVVTFFSWSNKNFALEKLSLLKVKSSYPTHPTDSYVTYFSKNFISTVGFTRLYLLMAKQWSAKLSSLTFKATHPIHPTDSYVTYFSKNFISTVGFTRLYLLMAKQWSAKLSSLTFKVAEHSFDNLWLCVICQIMARERLLLASWNLASEKCTDERFWWTGNNWRFRSFHGNINDWIQP